MLSGAVTDPAAVLNAFMDPGALTIVLAGTLIATIARCGWRSSLAAARALTRLGTARFDDDANRAALARAAPEIKRRGPLCADAPPPPDRSIARLVESYLINGSLDALHMTARAERTSREIARSQSMQVFEYAGELAPIFGLVGTLFAITQLTPDTAFSAAETAMAAIATAVLSTLYGVLTAHLVCVPLARIIERSGEREEAARAKLIDWFEAELTRVRPRAIAEPPARLRDELRDAA